MITLAERFPIIDLDAQPGAQVLGVNSGPVGRRLLNNNMDPRALRPFIGKDGMAYISMPTGKLLVNGKPELKNVPVANATLQKEEWLQFDTAVRQIARVRLPFVNFLRRRGLVLNISNALGTMVLQWQNVSDMNPAEMNMDGITRTSNDRLDFQDAYLPLPIVSKMWHLNLRTLEASRKLGQPLDTQQAAVSTIKVAEYIENMFINGASSYKHGGGIIYGITDHPNVNSVTLTKAWDGSGATGSTIVTDVKAMKQASIDAKHYGPWLLCIPTDYETVLDDDHKANSERTIRERVLAIEGIEDVMVVDKLSSNKVALVQLTPDCIEAVIGFDPRPVEWSTEGGMTENYKTMAITVPRIRPDQNGNLGIVIGTEP